MIFNVLYFLSMVILIIFLIERNNKLDQNRNQDSFTLDVYKVSWESGAEYFRGEVWEHAKVWGFIPVKRRWYLYKGFISRFSSRINVVNYKTVEELQKTFIKSCESEISSRKFNTIVKQEKLK